MTVVDEIEKIKVYDKLNYFFNYKEYFDYTLLESTDFVNKYQHLGFSFQNFFSIRFQEDDSLSEICSFLPDNRYYIIPIISNSNNIIVADNYEIEQFLNREQTNDYIIFETNMTWVLVYNKHRVLTGMGDFIKQRMKNNTNLSFGNSKILFSNTDE